MINFALRRLGQAAVAAVAAVAVAAVGAFAGELGARGGDSVSDGAAADEHGPAGRCGVPQRSGGWRDSEPRLDASAV